MTRSGPAASMRSAARRAMRYCALALMVVAVPEMARAVSACVGDCRELGRVTAADLVLMAHIAVGNREVAECSAGGVGEDDHITQDEIDRAIRSVFGGCSEETGQYAALAGQRYDIAYPTRLVSLTQAAAIVAALEDLGSTDEAALRALLEQLLGDLGIPAERIEQIGILAQREAGSCEDCVATCSGRCVQSPRGDCFCYERLPTDPARITILLLESSEDEPLALDAGRILCKDTSLHAGVNDSFSTANGIEPSSQSPGLLSLIQGSGNPPANFDQTSIDRLFGQTFTLPQGKCLVAAKVLLRARPIASSISPGSRNDVLRLGFVNPAGQFAGALWTAFFGTSPANTGLPILLSQQWTASNYPAPGASFVLDLASLPGGVNLLPALDTQRFLDVFMQDDSSIDYVDLVYRLCDCPMPPPPTPTRTATRTLAPTNTQTSTPSPGPCSVTICKQTTPAGGTGFNFSSGFIGLQGITVNHGQCIPRPVACGPIFDVFEVPKPGSTLSNIACAFSPGAGTFTIVGATVSPTGGFEPGDNQVIFDLNPGANLQCTFTNILHPTPTGTVTPTAAATSTPTPRPTASVTHTTTASATRTNSATRTATRTTTATPIATPTATPIGTITCVPPPPNMVAWWPLDDAAGATTVVDIALPPLNNGVPKPGPIQPSGPGPASVAGNLITSPPDGALYFYTQSTYVEVPHGSDLNLANSDLTIDAWVKPLPGTSWTAGRDSLHVYTIVDKLNLAANTGYAFFLQVRVSCPTCPPAGQQPPPSGAASTTEFRLAFALGNGSGLTIYTSAAFYSGSGTVFPFPTPASPLTPQPPSWTHAALTVDRNQNLGKFHLNGSHLIGSDFVPVAGLNNTDPLWIGGTRLYGTSHAPSFVEFTLNEIEVFDAALAQPDIQAIASALAGKCKPTPAPTATTTATRTRTPTRSATATHTRAPSATQTATRTASASATASRTATGTSTHTPRCVTPPPNMIAWWTADNTTSDFSGNGYHGTFFQPPGAYTAGMVGAAFSLPTIPDFVQASASLNFAGNFSIDAWILTTNTGLAAVIDKRLNAGFAPVGYYLFVLGGALGFELGDGQASLTHVSPGPNISDGNWHHVAVTVDRASTTGGHLYVDGAPVHTFDPTTRPGSTANGFPLRIGQAYISAIGFQGAIDEVELFDRELLSQEIQNLFQARSAGKCKTPLPTRTASPTITRTASASRTPTRTSTATGTATTSLTVTSTRTATPSRTATRTSTATGTSTASLTHTSTRTSTASRTATNTLAPSATATHTPTPGSTQTPTPSTTRTASATTTRTPTATLTRTPTVTPTVTPTPPCFGELCVLKFDDQDGDGFHDPGEPGVAGWTIHVTDPNMNVINVNTGAQGSFCVGVPAPVAYTVSEVPQNGWTQTFPPPPGTHNIFVECGQLLNIQFGNQSATRTPTQTATATRTPTRTSNLPPID